VYRNPRDGCSIPGMWFTEQNDDGVVVRWTCCGMLRWNENEAEHKLREIDKTRAEARAKVTRPTLNPKP
jgi:hypothetical protein